MAVGGPDPQHARSSFDNVSRLTERVVVNLPANRMRDRRERTSSAVFALGVRSGREASRSRAWPWYAARSGRRRRLVAGSGATSATRSDFREAVAPRSMQAGVRSAARPPISRASTTIGRILVRSSSSGRCEAGRPSADDDCRAAPIRHTYDGPPPGSDLGTDVMSRTGSCQYTRARMASRRRKIFDR
jgi:hypothetical protein